VAAAEEERFRRIKHWAGFPSQAITYCLREAGIALSDVEHVAVNQDNRVNLFRKIAYVVTHRPNPNLIIQRWMNRGARQNLPSLLGTEFPRQRFGGELHRVEHHLAHLSSAFHVSPFKNAVVMSVDGFGDFSSCAWGMGNGTDISVDGGVYFPHSLGIFYQALTQYLGFPHYGDEYKVMGLAPYGQPKFMEEMRQIVRLQPDGSYRLDLGYFRHHRSKSRINGRAAAPNFRSVRDQTGKLARTTPSGRRTA